MAEVGQQRLRMARTVFRVASGNFLEMYDFMVFGYFSAAIGRAYFPAASEFASLMFSLTTFAVGFLVRPLGAIFLGAYIDAARGFIEDQDVAISDEPSPDDDLLLIAARQVLCGLFDRWCLDP